MQERNHKHHRQGRLAKAVLASTLGIIGVLLFAGSASAGQWMEVSCQNPNQSAAPSQDWGSFGNGGYGSTTSTVCGPGSPMSAILSSDAAVGSESAETLQYTPPAGSTLAGGTINVGMYADGHGYDASGTAVIYTPNYAYDGSDVYFQCAWGQTPCSGGTNDFAGTLALPEGRGGDLFLSAGCGGSKGTFCSEGGSNGAWSLVRVWWADLLLSSNATPSASGFGGTLLAAGARGQSELTLTANDPAGPGVYTVTVQVDGKTLYAASPDNNGGKCVSVGATGGVLMFDYGQPCLASEALDIPVETAAVQDGSHTLKVSVQDAAGNSAVVYDSTISTQNAPEQSALPTLTEPQRLDAGSVLSALPGEWSAPAGAGKITYSYQWQDCDQQGNSCQRINGAQSSSYTVAPSDEGHTIRVAVSASDNDGKASASSAPSSLVLAPQSSLGANPGPGTSPETGQGNSNTSPTATSNAPSSPTGPAISSLVSAPGVGMLGAANGVAASRMAVLRITTSHALTRSFTRRAFVLRGQLLDTGGQPISGARLDVLGQTQGSSIARVIARAITRGDGSFTARVPKGPSRMVQVAYRAFALEHGYAAKASIRETVEAGARLRITPTSTTPAGSIVLTGTVQGVPRAGARVELLVFYRGRWVPIPPTETDAAGHFIVWYKFQNAVGRFPFRAEIPARQAGFPFARGYSNTVDVTAG